MQAYWYTKILVIYELISAMENKMFAAIKGSVWARYDEHDIICTNFFFTRTVFINWFYIYFPIHVL